MFNIKDWPDIKLVELKLDDKGYLNKIDVYFTPANCSLHNVGSYEK